VKLTSLICLAVLVVLGVAQCSRAQPAQAYKILHGTSYHSFDRERR